MQYVEVRSRELLELMGNFFGQRRFPHTAAQQRARDGQPPYLARTSERHSTGAGRGAKIGDSRAGE
jgi:hypothetical protein